MTIQEQIEQLRKEKNTLLAAVDAAKRLGFDTTNLSLILFDIDTQLAELEKQAVDSHKNAKALVAFWESDNSSGPLANVAKYVRHLENSLAAAEERANNTEPLCPRRVVATAAIVMKQSLDFLVRTGQLQPFPHPLTESHADTIRLLKQSAGTEAKPYKTIFVEDLDVCH